MARGGAPGGTAVNLAEVPAGSHATVTAIGGARAESVRLHELGLLPGTRVSVVRIAPLGDPLELRLRGYSLSVRRALARTIEVDDVGRDAR